MQATGHQPDAALAFGATGVELPYDVAIEGPRTGGSIMKVKLTRIYVDDPALDRWQG